MALMNTSGGDFRMVFWAALIPACLSIIVLLIAVKELPINHGEDQPHVIIRRHHIAAMPSGFWWVIVVATLLALSRFSQAFLVLKAHDAGMSIALIPLVLVIMHLVYSISAYPFGILADSFDRRLQLAIGIAILIVADAILAGATTVWLTLLGAALWGLQLGITQGLLAATVADIAPDRLRGTAFGIYDMAVGVGTFAASASMGALWAAGGPWLGFLFSSIAAAGAALALLFSSLPRSAKIPS
jgi:MFS family permease